jgi:drug/metabolite transporter (DMT)-like permease
MQTPLFLILSILALFLWIWALIDISRTKFKSSSLKIFWFLAILFFPILGSILYFQLGKKTAARTTRKFNPKFKR